mmetsp:Transcript_1506/g.2751  ORF Transcript_1506/g.2751 Transcript_1506/m.2751 type:complete len:330 (-) Transcript_1506:2506-3495(-)
MVDLIAEEEKSQVRIYNQQPMVTGTMTLVLNEDPTITMGHHSEPRLQKLSGNLHDSLFVKDDIHEMDEEKTEDEAVFRTEKHSRDASELQGGETPTGRFQGLEKKKEKSSKSVTYDISVAADTTSTNRLDPNRPSSAILRARRREHEQRELHLRGLMNTVSASYSGDEHSVSSTCTFNTVETSLLSHGRNLAKGQNIKWENVNVYVSFGLLTTPGDAPTEGTYAGIDDTKQNVMLGSIMDKMKTLSKAMIEQNTGNILMKCQDPFVTSIKGDETYTSRPGVVRSIVHTTVPLKLTDVHEELNNTSKIVAKVMVRQALTEGIQRGFFTSE